jgi:membrane associated rhomboid family serine protease
MNKLSLPAIAVFLIGAVGAIFFKDLFLKFEGPMEFIASAAAGAIGGLTGAIIGMILFPKPGDEDE